jgi:hypothetical protein
MIFERPSAEWEQTMKDYGLLLVKAIEASCIKGLHDQNLEKLHTRK